MKTICSRTYRCGTFGYPRKYISVDQGNRKEKNVCYECMVNKDKRMIGL